MGISSPQRYGLEQQFRRDQEEDEPAPGAPTHKTTISLPFTPEDVKNGRLPMTKARCLDLAKGAVADRGLNYGKPEDNFARIAARWRTHLKNRFGLEVPVDAASVAMMMQDMKLARLENDPSHLDSWVDAAGYAACGAEIAAQPK